MSIKEFLADLDKNPKLKEYFGKPDVLVSSLKELDNMIGMKQIKIQIVRQIKTFVANKARGVYKDSDRKHCLLLGPPGCGKTTVCKILCKVWIGMGFIGNEQNTNTVKTFDKLQDELIRRQRKELKSSKEKLDEATKCIWSVSKVSNICKRSMGTLLRNKSSINTKDFSEIYKNLSGCASLVEESTNKIHKLLEKKTTQDYSMQYEDEMTSTNKDPKLPFYMYNRNDVVSRYVGDTSHRTTKAMNQALDGVAYFDEAYNLCNDTSGLSDSYGRDALTIINQYMDTYSDKLIVVFSGYKDEIHNNLFKAQPGLESRFTLKVEIEPYSSPEMTQIYIKELKGAGISIPNTPQLNEIIKSNYKFFKFFGRDMNTLAMYTKNIMSGDSYERVMKGMAQKNVVDDLNIVRQAVDLFKQNMVKNVKNKRSLEELFNGLNPQ